MYNSALSSGVPAELDRDQDPAAAASQAGHSDPPVSGKARCCFTPTGLLLQQNPKDASMYRKKVSCPCLGRSLPSQAHLELDAGPTAPLIRQRHRPAVHHHTGASASFSYWKWWGDSVKQMALNDFLVDTDNSHTGNRGISPH